MGRVSDYVQLGAGQSSGLHGTLETQKGRVSVSLLASHKLPCFPLEMGKRRYHRPQGEEEDAEGEVVMLPHEGMSSLAVRFFSSAPHGGFQEREVKAREQNPESTAQTKPQMRGCRDALCRLKGVAQGKCRDEAVPWSAPGAAGAWQSSEVTPLGSGKAGGWRRGKPCAEVLRGDLPPQCQMP